MTLRHLLPTIRTASAAAQFLGHLQRGSGPVTVSDLPLSARPVLIATAIDATKAPVLVVTARTDRADRLVTAINEYLPPDRQAVLWPGPEVLPYEQLPFDMDAATRRVALLDRLAHHRPETAPVIVATAHGLHQLLMPTEELTGESRTLRVGDRLDIAGLLKWAVHVGYQMSPLVQEPGTFARRGGILDLFPPAAEQPIRLDLFGDEIESLRTFDPSSQRSDKKLRQIRLLPPTELPLWRLREAAAKARQLPDETLRPEVLGEWHRMLERMEVGALPPSIDLFAPYLLTRPTTLLDHFPADSLVVLDEPGAIRLASTQLDAQANELAESFVSNGELPAGLPRPVADWTTIQQGLQRHARVEIGLEHDSDQASALSFATFGEAPVYAGRLKRIIDDIGERLRDGWRVTIATDQVQRLTELFEEAEIFPRRDKRREQSEPTPLDPGMLEIRASDLDGGYLVPALKLLVLSDLELFGFRKQTSRGVRRSLSENVQFANSLTPGEFVVHIDHGIARFTELTRVNTSGVEREYLLLVYAKGDKLYVPIDQSDRVTRYSGGGIDPEPTKLGSGEWVRVKTRVRKAVREMAYELVQLYAVRETGNGHPFPGSTTWDAELAESFPYTETPDQMRSINDVVADLETDRPMDRLICGDVGFGKTEVALRAAFKVVNAGKQVAVLVPTTVLALQHFTTFSQRLAAFPVKVEMLSRLKSKAEQGAILEGLEAGSVDIVIGTHRLVQRDIKFKDLGLVVIDEEQRFGVRHKEFLKQLRTEVDVLTMSATPIPRTLHMAMAGLRDISVIDTAPQARLPIRTFVTDASDHLIREVILREIDRGGQVYVVHNRVHSINQLASRLRELVPEARFGVGHGQMDEAVLEEVILSFVRHEYDVLISTTIIESGIDIPNVNSIVIDNADTLGLTQLYQLRGRVGRAASRGYAYLLHKPGKVLTRDAQERLEAIQEATELGAGLRVAMRDMEIRGAGNILGAEQSGHIAAIGYDLYIRLLAQAVEEIKQGFPIADPHAITLDLPLAALIPADYVTDTELRLSTYRRVASITTYDALAEMRKEFLDRFGPLPEEVEHLFALIAVRIRCADLGIDSVVEREREIVIRPVETAHLDTRKLARTYGSAIKLTPNSIRIRLPDLKVNWEEALDGVLDIVERTRAPLVGVLGAED